MAVRNHLEVQVTSRGESGGADSAHTLTPLNVLANADPDGREVVVRGDDPMAADDTVVQFHLRSVPTCPACADNGSLSGCTHGGTAWRSKVKAGVQLPDFADGVETHAKTRRFVSLNRH